MRYTYAAMGMIIIGLMGFVVLIVFQDITINNESDYYSIKEAMEASMVEAIDKNYYARTGELKIVEQKFVANFTRRFVNNSVGDSQEYTINFYDIMESPPKATVVIQNETEQLIISNDNAEITNNITGILEATVDRNTVVERNCNGIIKTGNYERSGYYSSLPRPSYTQYKLRVDTIMDEIVSGGIDKEQILELRVVEVKNAELVNGTETINYGNVYTKYLDGGIWKNVPSSIARSGSEDNYCYTSGVHLSIVDSIGYVRDQEETNPIVQVTTETNETSISGCTGGNGNSLVKYQVVWEYDYCDS